MKFKVTDRATGTVHYLTAEELAKMPRSVPTLVPGDDVEIGSTGTIGHVVSVDGGNVTVKLYDKEIEHGYTDLGYDEFEFAERSCNKISPRSEARSNRTHRSTSTQGVSPGAKGRSRQRWPEIPSDLPRAVAIKLIREALRKRSGKAWSVTGGTGTAYGWLHIDAPPARRIYEHDGVTKVTKGAGYSGERDRKELAKLLGLEAVHHQGESIPASGDHYREYIERARGLTPTKRGEQYWD